MLVPIFSKLGRRFWSNARGRLISLIIHWTVRENVKVWLNEWTGHNIFFYFSNFFSLFPVTVPIFLSTCSHSSQSSLGISCGLGWMYQELFEYLKLPQFNVPGLRLWLWEKLGGFIKFTKYTKSTRDFGFKHKVDHHVIL